MVGKDTATLSELRAQAPAFSILIATESKHRMINNLRPG